MFLPEVFRRRVSDQQGFTLVEILVAVAIVGLLAAIAIPSYERYSRKAVRADARNQLMQAAQYMQRFYAASDRYDQDRSGTAVATLMPTTLKRAPASGTKLYDLQITATADTFTLKMVRTSGARMASDECGNYTLTSTGARGLESTSGGMTVDSCWK